MGVRTSMSAPSKPMRSPVSSSRLTASRTSCRLCRRRGRPTEILNEWPHEGDSSRPPRSSPSSTIPGPEPVPLWSFCQPERRVAMVNSGSSIDEIAGDERARRASRTVSLRFKSGPAHLLLHQNAVRSRRLLTAAKPPFARPEVASPPHGSETVDRDVVLTGQGRLWNDTASYPHGRPL